MATPLVAVTMTARLKADDRPAKNRCPMVLVPKPDALKSGRALLHRQGKDSAEKIEMPAELALFHVQDRDTPNPACAASYFIS